jgi:pimeloyl-ACP methyl ester carboxylesterase
MHTTANGNEVTAVAVPGGALAVELIGSGPEPVLVIHGISSQRKLWNWLHAVAPGLALVAPDLRGRGDSAAVTGPSSVSRHAADMIAVLDALGLRSVHVCGMSMGGFVAVELAVSFPGRVKSLILVDGGFPMAVPAGLTPESLPAVFADRLTRLGRDWPDVTDYAGFFVAQTAPLLDPSDPLLLDYLRHDLAGRRVRLSGAGLSADAADIFFGFSKWQQLTVPVRLITAEWSTGRDSAPAYPPAAVAAVRAQLGSLVTVRPAPETDHASSIMTIGGAAVASAEITRALA